MILLIDNYDSFVYNIYQYIAEINSNVIVKRNDQINLEEIKTLSPTHIILSPGPKLPNNAGICLDLIKKFHTSIPIFGICLGHQAIVEALGGKIEIKLPVMHGKTSEINHTGGRLFKLIPKQFTATRYHSLVATEVPEAFNIVASDNENTVMAIEHNSSPIFGVQYHPESILSEYGKQHFKNFLSL